MEANAGKAFQMQIIFNIFPRISLHCKLVPVQYWEYEYGLLYYLIIPSLSVRTQLLTWMIFANPKSAILTWVRSLSRSMLTPDEPNKYSTGIG